MKRLMRRMRPAASILALALAALALSPSRSHAQYFGGGYGYGGPGYGGYGNGGLGYGGIGYGGMGYGGFGGIYGGVGNALYDPYYINFGLNPTTLATGITPLAIQSAIANQNLLGTARMSPAAPPQRPIILTPGTYRLIIER